MAVFDDEGGVAEVARTSHALEKHAVLQALLSAESGLTTEEARARFDRIGPNRLPEPEPEGMVKRFLKHFHDTLIYVLITAAIITAFLEHWVDTGVILAVVVINAIIGFLQEGKAEAALAGIRKMLSLHAHALRDGQWVELEADGLVPGDVVRLRSGDKVPADLRLLEVSNLRVEEAALTGESVPVEKGTEAVELESPLGDRTCMAYSGSIVTTGRGVAVVTGTGAQTELGRINRMIAEVEPMATPLTRQMTRFGKVLSLFIIGMAGVMFGLGHFLHGSPVSELFFASIGFAVAAIPEGLPAVMTITLALGVQRMAARNAITRRLPAVETLGSVTVICSDKTGTLTRNEMTVRAAITRASAYSVSGTGYEPQGEVRRESEGDPIRLDHAPDFQALLEVLTVCNDAALRQDRDGHWSLTGEPTEGALLTLARKAGFNAESYHRLASIPFESENKFMATLNRAPDGSIRILLKGAPDRLLDRCAFEQGPDGAPQKLDREFWENQIDRLGGQGQRVLAAAVRLVDADKGRLSLDDLGGDLLFLGLVGIIDPPRPEAVTAIRTCREAGIRVKMITGDHLATAAAIGREMGLSDNLEAVTGEVLEAASDEELRGLVRRHDVFARTSPEHKLRLVKALQANGDVVAMTGDGVNDAPALKRADVGVAMGIKGTEATKEAAEIVLADDNFASIERAVEEGRTIYDNLRKAILFILPTNGAEALVILAAVVAGFALPLTPVQILWVNMVTAVTLALALAFEPAEPGLMRRPPRKPGTPILGRYFLWRIGFVSFLIGGATVAVFLVEKAMEMPLETARTLAVNTLVAGQLFYLFNSRFLHECSCRLSRLLGNRVALLASGVLILLQLAFVYAPFMNHWFGSVPLEARHWMVPLGIGVAVFFLAEAEKAIHRRIKARHHPSIP